MPKPEQYASGSLADYQYGGMTTNDYEEIINFKLRGTEPLPHPLNKTDRGIYCHWKSRVSKFAVAEDKQTLLHIPNPHAFAGSLDAPRIVLKNTETFNVCRRIHEMIGHLGTKRTQMAISKYFYWRSIRSDVKEIVSTCHHCIEKKLSGKKIVKAAVDLIRGDVVIDITVLSTNQSGGDSDKDGGTRFRFSINGVPESEATIQSQNKLSTYTFRETFKSPALDKGENILKRPMLQKVERRLKKQKKEPLESDRIEYANSANGHLGLSDTHTRSLYYAEDNANEGYYEDSRKLMVESSNPGGSEFTVYTRFGERLTGTVSQFSYIGSRMDFALAAYRDPPMMLDEELHHPDYNEIYEAVDFE
uniref:Integrase_H2C2 domain-containing protein n=1 Tax=Rhabditophanes sp. KR3021 TaxID=114890 RepID=A0AC35UEY5_9BILA